jgi:hypothetical protein
LKAPGIYISRKRREAGEWRRSEKILDSLKLVLNEIIHKREEQEKTEEVTQTNFEWFSNGKKI